MKYVTGKLGFDKGLLEAVRMSVKAYDCEQLTLIFDTAESVLEDEKQLEKLFFLAVKSYLTNNWKAIKPLKLRNLGIEGTVLEPVKADTAITGYRIKKQGRNWRKQERSHLVAIMTAQKNGTLKHCIVALAHIKPFSDDLVISMRQVLKK